MKKLAVLSLVALTFACSGAEDPIDPDAGTPGVDPLYAVITQVAITAGETQSYLVTVDDLEKDQSVGLTEAMELPADSYIVAGTPGAGRFFISSSKQPIVTPYTLEADGTITAGDPLSFIGQGVAATGGYQSQHHFVSGTKAYYFDHVNYRLVIWNPEDVSIIGSKDLTAQLKDGDFTFRYSQSMAIPVGTSVIVAGGWHAADVKTVPSKTALVIVDTGTDEVRVVTDDRCGWARDGAVHDGKIYFATESLGSGAHFVSPQTTAAPCMIRYDIAEGRFDDWFTTLDRFVSPQTEGDVAGMLLPGAPGKGYLRVMDKAAAQAALEAANTAGRPFHGSHAATGAWWSLWEVTLGDAPTATPVVRDDLVPMNGRTIPQSPGGGVLVMPEFINSNAQTRFRIVSPQTGLGDAKTIVEGQVRGLLRIR